MEEKVREMEEKIEELEELEERVEEKYREIKKINSMICSFLVIDLIKFIILAVM
ncbi:hypothetical protein [Clostridium massiliamazoniense]|uniref:hypothetical protein n=1 Tax=Clostridium massiliamazoniense TaxID=1347366 RepID=UPI000AEA7CE8|nr:hypothetical protein [Clostridium massiliamazoniense]